MREAPAGAKHDFLSRDDRRGDAQRGGKRAKALSSKGWLGFLGSRRRSTIAVFLGFTATAAIGVPLNALYLQDGRHPAPLFQAGAPPAAATAPQSRPALTEAASMPPQQRPAAAVAKTPPAKAVIARKPVIAKTVIAKTVIAKTVIARKVEKALAPIKKSLVGGAPQKSVVASKTASKTVVVARPALATPSNGPRPGGADNGAKIKAIQKLARAPAPPAKAENALKLPPKPAAKPDAAKQ